MKEKPTKDLACTGVKCDEDRPEGAKKERKRRYD
jgi:hypothetical protein